jgi:uncharacterized protein (DUF2147 family)
MMRWTHTSLLSAGLGCLGVPIAHAANIDGVWLRDDGNARVRIAPCGDKICATNLWIGNTSKGEAAGDKLIMTLKRTSDTAFSGTAFDPKRRLSYAIDVTVGNGTLVTRGCVLARLLCKSVGWSMTR